MTRGSRSALPPAGKGTIIRTGFDGHSCPELAAATSSPANRKSNRIG
jgi:hypothetical protein